MNVYTLHITNSKHNTQCSVHVWRERERERSILLHALSILRTVNTTHNVHHSCPEEADFTENMPQKYALSTAATHLSQYECSKCDLNYTCSVSS